jgi:hypothetical protein
MVMVKDTLIALWCEGSSKHKEDLLYDPEVEHTYPKI